MIVTLREGDNVRELDVGNLTDVALVGKNPDFNVPPMVFFTTDNGTEISLVCYTDNEARWILEPFEALVKYPSGAV